MKQKEKNYIFFLNTKLIWNDNYKKLFSIKKTTNFQIEELKKIENEEDVLKNNVIKVKNYFSTVLLISSSSLGNNLSLFLFIFSNRESIFSNLKQIDL